MWVSGNSNERNEKTLFVKKIMGIKVVANGESIILPLKFDG